VKLVRESTRRDLRILVSISSICFVYIPSFPIVFVILNNSFSSLSLFLIGAYLAQHFIGVYYFYEPDNLSNLAFKN